MVPLFWNNNALESFVESRQLKIAFVMRKGVTFLIQWFSINFQMFIFNYVKINCKPFENNFQSSLEFVMFMNFNTLNWLSETNLHSHSKYCSKIWSPLFLSSKRCGTFINFSIMTSTGNDFLFNQVWNTKSSFALNSFLLQRISW